jgi:type IV secretion system protein VirB9
LGLLLLPGAVHAEKAPPGKATKPAPVKAAAPEVKVTPVRVRPTSRVRTVVYQGTKVVPLVVHSFRVALIEFGADEKIQTVRIGDSEGWETSQDEVGNHLFVKARLEGVASNLIVVTDRRTYTFDLESRKEGDRIQETTYHLRFAYPEDERAREAAFQKRAAERQQTLVSSTMDPARLHFGYAFAGDSKLVPELLFDDGEATYFRFANVKDLPAIFVVEEVGGEKREALANYRVQGEYVVVHRIADQFSLRVGERLACIRAERKKTPDVAASVNAPQEKQSVSLLRRWWGGGQGSEGRP